MGAGAVRPMHAGRALGHFGRNPGARGWAVAALVAALFVGGCTSGQDSGDGPDVVGGSGEDAARMQTEQDGAGDVATEGAMGASASDRTGPGAQIQAASQVVVTGSAEVRVADPAAALEDFSSTLSGLGGSLAESRIGNNSAHPSASATARVPADRYQDLVDSLPDLGEVLTSTTSSQDVGQVVADLDARAKALETSTARLQELIDQATSTQDLLEAENQLTTRQAELDSINAQRRYLADQVSMSTLSVDFTAVSTVADPDRNVWQRSWDAFLGALQGIGTGLVWAMPWLVVAGLVIGLVAAVRRRSRGRSRTRSRDRSRGEGERLPDGEMPPAGESSDGSGAPGAQAPSASGEGPGPPAQEQDEVPDGGSSRGTGVAQTQETESEREG